MPHLRLDISSLRDLAVQLKYSIEESTSTLQAMQARLSPGTVWEGDIPPPYAERFDIWRTAEEQRIDALRELQHLVDQIATTFDETNYAGAEVLTAWPPARGMQGGREHRRHDFEPSRESTLSVEVYISADDTSIAQKVFRAVDDLLDAIGCEAPVDIEVIQGSIWRRAKTNLKKGLSSDEVQTRLAKIERAIELANIDGRQADVDAKQAEAVTRLLGSLNEVPQACIRVGSLLLIKYTEPGGPVVLTRNLSQVEIHTLNRFPEIQTKPREALGALASAIAIESQMDRL